MDPFQDLLTVWPKGAGDMVGDLPIEDVFVKRPLREEPPPLPSRDYSKFTAHDLISDLENKDIRLRDKAIQNLDIIFRAIDFSTTLKIIIPKLFSISEECEESDELLLALAKNLACVKYIWKKENLFEILPTLFLLLGNDERIIRQSALSSILSFIPYLSKDDIDNHVFPVIIKLSQEDWFSKRLAVSGLFSPLYDRLNKEQRNTIRSIYYNLCNDSILAVRRAATSQYGLLAKNIEYENFNSEYLLQFDKIVTDTEATVRSLAIIAASESILPIIIKNNKKQNNYNNEDLNRIFKVLQDSSKDSDFRVRETIVNELPLLASLLLPLNKITSLINILITLLQDTEKCVRLSAISSLSSLAKYLPVDSDQFSKIILPEIKKIVENVTSDDDTRTRLVSKLLDSLPNLSKTQSKNIIPLIVKLLEHGSIDVRIGGLEQIDNAIEVLSPQELTQLLPPILSLTQSNKWRVRLTLIEKLGNLSKKFGPDFTKNNILPSLTICTSDSVQAVRLATCNQIASIAITYGEEWAINHVIPLLTKQINQAGYLHRLSTLGAITKLSCLFSQEATAIHLLPLVLSLCNDNVANVRFTAAKTLGELITCVNNDIVKKQIIPTLEKLQNDNDADVVHFTKIALKQS